MYTHFFAKIISYTDIQYKILQNKNLNMESTNTK